MSCLDWPALDVIPPCNLQVHNQTSHHQPLTFTSFNEAQTIYLIMHTTLCISFLSLLTLPHEIYSRSPSLFSPKGPHWPFVSFKFCIVRSRTLRSVERWSCHYCGQYNSTSLLFPTPFLLCFKSAPHFQSSSGIRPIHVFYPQWVQFLLLLTSICWFEKK